MTRAPRPGDGTRVLGTLVAAALLVGCGIGEGGMGLPAQRTGETYPGVRQEVSGTFEVAGNGCFELRVDGAPLFVIWPAGSQLNDRVRLPDGQAVAEGDLVVGTGALTPTAALAAKGGYWANALGFCAQGDEQVLVLDTAAVDPAG